MTIHTLASLPALRSSELLEEESSIPREQEEVRHTSSSASFAYALPEFISAVRDVRTKPSYIDKCQALKKAYENGKTVAGNADEIINIVEVSERLADKNVSWSGPLSWILLPLQALALATGIYRVYKTHQFLKELDSKIPDRQEESARGRISAVRASLRFLKAKSAKALHAHFALGEQSPVTDKLTSLLRKLSSRNAEEKAKALQEGEALLGKLKTRVKRKIGFEIAATISRVITITLSVLLLTTPPGLILSAAVLAASAIGTGIKAYKKKALPENPNYLN